MTDPLLDHKGTELNYWPAFADLMLAVVFVLVLVLFSVAVALSAGQIDFEQVKVHQGLVINEMAASLGSSVDTFETDDGEVYAIRLKDSSGSTVQIKNEFREQRITFSDRVLFDPDSVEISDEGLRVLALVGGALAERLDWIREIQIQGHADTNPTGIHGSNVKLAALRAAEVFEYLHQEVGIEPGSNLMSATSFGEYLPVARSTSERDFTEKRLQEANETAEQRAANRRIELLLFYRLD